MNARRLVAQPFTHTAPWKLLLAVGAIGMLQHPAA